MRPGAPHSTKIGQAQASEHAKLAPRFTKEEPLAEEFIELEEDLEDEAPRSGSRRTELEPAALGERGSRRRPSRTTKRRSGQHFRQTSKVCGFCMEKVTHIDYKDVTLLQRYITEGGKIQPRRKTGTCSKHQGALARAIKRARYMALLPYTPEHVRLYGS